MPLTGKIFDISRACVEDGPGIRTVVFLKGCALSCPWCHNPEGISFDPEIGFDAARCIGCETCLEICPRGREVASSESWRTGCLACGRCAEVCPARARRLAGRIYGVEELVEAVMTDADFFAGTGGGVTFSGGEPLAQPDFMIACARELRHQGIHVAVETAGFWPETLAVQVKQSVDLILFDLKHVDSKKFRDFVGREQDRILANLKTILAGPGRVEVRITLIPGFNDTPEDQRKIACWLTANDLVPPVTLIPFHRLGAAKQELFGRPNPYSGTAALPRECMAEAEETLRKEGIEILR